MVNTYDGLTTRIEFTEVLCLCMTNNLTITTIKLENDDGKIYHAILSS